MCIDRYYIYIYIYTYCWTIIPMYFQIQPPTLQHELRQNIFADHCRRPFEFVPDHQDESWRSWSHRKPGASPSLLLNLNTYCGMVTMEAETNSTNLGAFGPRNLAIDMIFLVYQISPLNSKAKNWWTIVQLRGQKSSRSTKGQLKARILKLY